MQDGATPHRTNKVFEILNEYFNHRVIGLNYPKFCGGGLEWPPYSPDLNPCDFFLWGYVKDRTYTTQITSIDELKTKITDIVTKIPKETLHSIFDSFYSRLKNIVKMNGNLYQNLIN